VIQLPCYYVCLIIQNTHRCIGNSLFVVLVPRHGVKRAQLLIPLIKHTIIFKKWAEIIFTYPDRICIFHYKHNGCNRLLVIVIEFSKPCINFAIGDSGFSYIPPTNGWHNHSISII
jgi:hypothetical protein